jgi:arylsulfatase A-like enzyme
MLTGMDVINTQVVALRHQGDMSNDLKTFPEIIREHGYKSCCVGFTGNPSSRGFDEYLDYTAWGSWGEGRLPKAENLNAITIPKLEEYIRDKEPFLMFLRHMDPHAPYLPPGPFERMFYNGNECDPANKSMEPVLNFKPFCDFHASWMPPGISDKDYIVAQYDGEIAYMDSCIQNLIQVLESHNILEDTIIVINSDHGETLYEHDCYFDHHGLYESNLHVPLILRYPRKINAGSLIESYTSHKDLLPTLLEIMGIQCDIAFDGKSRVSLLNEYDPKTTESYYITECTWMRKHGWRTEEWKLIIALEPDFHFKTEIELYNLKEDPKELNNLSVQRPDMVDQLTNEMKNWLEKRKIETGKDTPIYDQGDWHGLSGVGSFKTSQQAYDALYLGDTATAKRLQEKSR